MSERIGDTLVRQGVIHPGQLEAALESQVLVGARLGTNLVEQGAVGLDALADALAEQRGIPAAKKHHFERADRALQAKLSPRLAGTWHAVPLGIRERDGRVVVAVLDPLPPKGAAEFEAALKGPLLQAVAPELRILYELERGFGLRRPNRFLRVPPPKGNPPEAERRRYVRTLSDEPDAEAGETLARVAIRQVAVSASPAIEAPAAIETFSDALRAIRRATGRERVAEVALEAIRRGFSDAVGTAVLFVIREHVAFGWKGYGGRADVAIEDLAVPLAEPSLLSAPIHRGPYAGPVPAEVSAIDRQLWALLGAEPTSVAIAPVDVSGRTACLLYAHSETPDTFSAVAGHRLSELAQAMSTAFDFLIRAAER